MLCVSVIIGVKDKACVGISLQYLNPLLQQVSAIKIIVMEQGNVGSSRLRNGEVGVAGHAHIRRCAHRPDSFVLSGNISNLLPGSVCGTIVADDNFITSNSLIKDRVQS